MAQSHSLLFRRCSLIIFWLVLLWIYSIVIKIIEDGTSVGGLVGWLDGLVLLVVVLLVVGECGSETNGKSSKAA